MITGIEYLFLSNLAYCRFNKKDIGLTLKSILHGGHNEENRKRILTNKNNLINIDNFELSYAFFQEYFEQWKVLGIEDQTAGSDSSFKRVSGFFAMAFTRRHEVVIAYRGSETASLEDAYRDFIENDLLISFGKRPPQFDEGYKFYKNIIEDGCNPENIRLTGHSLGGGIAQYVAVMSQKDGFALPNTCTWNSVGIQKDGIISLEDFVDFETLLHKNFSLDKRYATSFLKFKSAYFNFLIKTLKRRRYMPDKNNINDIISNFHFQLTEDELSEFEKIVKTENFSQILSSLNTDINISTYELTRVLFDENIILNALVNWKRVFNDFKENKIYENVILNFVHSKDLTTALFKHIGTVYIVDQNFSKIEKTNNNKFFKSFSLFSKSFKNYHLSDVFLPFIVTEGSEKGKLSRRINDEYTVSSIRKLIKLEEYCDKELLLTYYQLEKLNSDNIEMVRTLLLNSFQRMNDEIKFKEQIVKEIKNSEFKTLQKLWLKSLLKLSSPYESKDMYDYLLFEL